MDVVTTDGAALNGGMWNKFGISENVVSCEHIFDNNRRLWFMSDFPHLIKNLRNSLIKQNETWVNLIYLFTQEITIYLIETYYTIYLGTLRKYFFIDLFMNPIRHPKEE